VDAVPFVVLGRVVDILRQHRGVREALLHVTYHGFLVLGVGEAAFVALEDFTNFGVFEVLDVVELRTRV
jgi:hypothetical protein